MHEDSFQKNHIHEDKSRATYLALVYFLHRQEKATISLKINAIWFVNHFPKNPIFDVRIMHRIFFPVISHTLHVIINIIIRLKFTFGSITLVLFLF